MLTITGSGFTKLARTQPREGVNIFLVRPEGDRFRFDLVWTYQLAPNGDFGLAHAVPDSLELFPPPAAGDPAPRMVPTSPGRLQVAVGSPADRIPGAIFQVRGAEVGVSYPHRLVNKCSVLATVFDGQLWVSDPTVALGPTSWPSGWSDGRDLPGTFILTDPHRAEFRSASGDFARFRRPTEPSKGC